MIYRETIWKEGDVAVVEVIPLATSNIAISFSRFRMRASMQHVMENGIVQASYDVPIEAEDVADAIEKAKALKPLKDKELVADLSSKLERMYRDQVNAAAAGRVAGMPRIAEDNGVSER